jgi:hypothetical protein
MITLDQSPRSITHDRTTIDHIDRTTIYHIDRTTIIYVIDRGTTNCVNVPP